MKKIITYHILLWIIFIQSSIYGQYNPCYDELYLGLKASGINSMTTREYHYFTRKDEECAEYNTFDKKYHDQLNSMQDEILKIGEKLGELDEDINLENIYGLGRLKATDPELRSLAIMQSKDDDIRNEFNTLIEKLFILKKELQEEIQQDDGPADLIVNSLTVVDSVDGGYIKTISKDGKNTVMIGNHPSGSGSVITYNKEGSPSVRIGSGVGAGGYLSIRKNSGKNAAFVGTDENGNNVIITNNSKGDPAFMAGGNDDEHGYMKTVNSNGQNTTLVGSKKEGAGYITTFSSSGKRTSFISSDRSGTGMMGLYDKNQKLQWSQKGTKPVADPSDSETSDPKN
jgi:hypothetical protein